MENHIKSWIQQKQIVLPELLFEYYKELNIDEKQFILLLQLIVFYQKGVFFPTPIEIAERTGFSERDVQVYVHDLLKKQVLEIKSNSTEEDRISEAYSFDYLWEKLWGLHVLSCKNQVKNVKDSGEESLYTLFEQEFGRPLSPHESEMLSILQDQDNIQPELIKEALREAILSNTLSMKYIDRILFEWKKQGITSIDEARQFGKRVRQNQQSDANNEQKDQEGKKIPLYNWLENS